MWTRRDAEWNPGLIILTRTQRKAWRPAKRWEDDSNEFVKDEVIKATQRNDLKNNNTWLVAAKNVYEWEKERQYPKHVIDDNDKLPAHPSTTNDDIKQQHNHQRPRVFKFFKKKSTQESEDIQSLDWYTLETKDSLTSGIRGILVLVGCTKRYDQDKWLFGSLPACKKCT